MSEENVETVRRCFELWIDRGDDSFVEELVDPEATYDLSRNQLNPDVYAGHEGFRRWLKTVDEVWEEFSAVPEELIGAGDNVFVAVRMSGRGKGSGVAVDMQVFNVWTFRDGKVWRITGGYRDRDEALEAAGIEGETA